MPKEKPTLAGARGSPDASRGLRRIEIRERPGLTSNALRLEKEIKHRGLNEHGVTIYF